MNNEYERSGALTNCLCLLRREGKNTTVPRRTTVITLVKVRIGSHIPRIKTTTKTLKRVSLDSR